MTNINKTKKNSLAFKGYKIMEENLKRINEKHYYDLKRCSQQNCRKVFDDTIKESDKLHKKHHQERIVNFKKNMEFVIKKYNLPKNYKLKVNDPAFKELIKLNAKSREKRLEELKKINKNLNACHEKHCKEHKEKLTKTVKKYIKSMKKRLQKNQKQTKKN